MNDLPDTDPQETLEWRDALQALIATQGPQRASYILGQLAQQAQSQQLHWAPPTSRPYVNTVSAEQQPMFPGDLAIEERLGSLMRWNALAMVARANAAYGELGGHIASYASAADLFEVGFNHFFHARTEGHTGVCLEGRDAGGILVVHGGGARVAGRLRPHAHRGRRWRRDALRAQGRRVREGGHLPQPHAASDRPRLPEGRFGRPNDLHHVRNLSW